MKWWRVVACVQVMIIWLHVFIWAAGVVICLAGSVEVVVCTTLFIILMQCTEYVQSTSLHVVECNVFSHCIVGDVAELSSCFFVE